MLRDPYIGSTLVEKTAKLKKWSVLDLDGTYAAGPLWARTKLREILESSSAFIFSTARTPELVMSEHLLARSREYEFGRPRPHWISGPEGGTRLYTDYADLEYERDPDAIFGFGTGLYLRNDDAYRVDSEYAYLYLDESLSLKDIVKGKPTWRKQALELVHRFGYERNMADIEHEERYYSGEANVFPLQHRVQLDFYGPNALAEKKKALRRFNLLKKKFPAMRAVAVDESKPDAKHYTMYLMPPQARKEDILNRALAKSCMYANVLPMEVKILMAGDTLTDFLAGCYGGWDADMEFVLVGGSRLEESFLSRENFAGEDLQSIYDALRPTDQPGVYEYLNPFQRGGKPVKANGAFDAESLGAWEGMMIPPETVGRHFRSRKIIIGRQTYPGTVGAETILAHVEASRKTTKH